jgi:hypothetical protein
MAQPASPARLNRRDALCGALFIALAALFALGALGLETGTARRMGPGYFPLLLSGVLGLLGAVILFNALRSGPGEIGALAWRGMAFILPAPILFGLTVRGLGLAPAIALTALVAALASRRMSLPMALLTSAAITAFSVAVFSYALGLPYQRIGPWLAPFLGG